MEASSCLGLNPKENWLCIHQTSTKDSQMSGISLFTALHLSGSFSLKFKKLSFNK
jgi:hypothetical protein